VLFIVSLVATLSERVAPPISTAATRAAKSKRRHEAAQAQQAALKGGSKADITAKGNDLNILVDTRAQVRGSAAGAAAAGGRLPARSPRARAGGAAPQPAPPSPDRQLHASRRFPASGGLWGGRPGAGGARCLTSAPGCAAAWGSMHAARCPSPQPTCCRLQEGTIKAGSSFQHLIDLYDGHFPKVRRCCCWQQAARQRQRQPNRPASWRALASAPAPRPPGSPPPPGCRVPSHVGAPRCFRRARRWAAPGGGVWEARDRSPRPPPGIFRPSAARPPPLPAPARLAGPRPAADV
jgi:hypothetical protein